ncbi:MAG: hypothetical protein JW751_26990 [Polyangiaceae bacterium]|nr:hypothetical protein [Polyangiaceae bacterium]
MLARSLGLILAVAVLIVAPAARGEDATAAAGPVAPVDAEPAPVGAESAPETSTGSRCAVDYNEGTQARKAGDLLTAYDRYRACSQPRCPELVRDECERALVSTRDALPSLVLAATDGAGRDLTSVTVYLDGQEVRKELTGAPLEVNPGKRVFRLVAADGSEQTVDLLVVQGQKLRQIAVRLGSSPGAPTASSSGQQPELPTSLERGPVRSGQRLAAFTSLGIGAAGVVAGAVIGAVALGKQRELDTHGCVGTSCYRDQKDEVEEYDSLRHPSTIGFFVGAVGIVTGTALLVTPRTTRKARPRAVAPFVGFATAGVRGAF